MLFSGALQKEEPTKKSKQSKPKNTNHLITTILHVNHIRSVQFKNTVSERDRRSNVLLKYCLVNSSTPYD